MHSHLPNFHHLPISHQAARKIAVARFRAGRVGVLITTDVAARGIDIPLIDVVVHYDFPPKPALFVHRCGRAARAGRRGAALALLSREELPYLLDLALLLGRRPAPAPATASPDDVAAAGDAGLGPDGGLDVVPGEEGVCVSVCVCVCVCVCVLGVCV